MEHKLLATLGKFKETTTGEFNFCCPLCVHRIGRPDKGFHLYVNPSRYLYGIRGWFYCHRCHARGPMYRLLGKAAEQTVPVTEWSTFVKKLRGEHIDKEGPGPQPVKLPEDYIEMIRGTEAYGYLANRCISDEQIAFYKIGFGTEDLRDMKAEERTKFAGSGRIIFPDFDDEDNCIYWVARTYKGHKVKYKNPGRSHARNQVYNLARASRFKTCVVAEGVTSAIACGYNGVATYGKEVTENQISMLASAAFDHYTIAHDGDARPEALDLATRLSRRGRAVSLVEFSQEQDPASVEDMPARVDRALSWSLKNQLRFKLR
jgi:hypothetical protein